MEYSIEQKINKLYDKFENELKRKWNYGTQKVLIKQGTGREFCEEGILSVLKGIYGLDIDKPYSCWCFRAEKVNNTLSGYESNISGEVEYMLSELMYSICNAVNNTSDNSNYKSYSKNLAAPLFKYISPKLIIEYKNINYLMINLQVQIFEWVGENGISWDRYGNEISRNHEEEREITIPFRAFCSKKELFKELEDYFELLVDIDDVDFEIIGCTIDVSAIDRNVADKYYERYDLPKFKRFASYKSDAEIISTESEYGEHKIVIHNQDFIDIIRFMYILCIANKETKFNIIYNALKNKELGDFSGYTKEINWIYNYLYNNKQSELEGYQKIYNNRNDEISIKFQLFQSYTLSEIIEILEEHKKKFGIFNNDNLFKQMKNLIF